MRTAYSGSVNRIWSGTLALGLLASANLGCSDDKSGSADAGQTQDGAAPREAGPFVDEESTTEAGASGDSAVVNDAETTDRVDDLYVGCRDPGLGTIQHYRISTLTGAVMLVDTALANAEVSNVAWNADKSILYVAHTDIGRITTFIRSPTTGSLTLQAFIDVPGSPDAAMNPATQTLELDHTGKFLLAANYTANTVLVYGVKSDGSVGDLVKSLSDGQNAHQTLLTQTNDYVLVPYLGSNFIAVYGFDQTTGNLTPHTPLTTSLSELGAGPRHLSLHANGKWLYTITENAGTIESFDFDHATAILAHKATVSSLPSTFTGTQKSGSEIEIDPTGHFLYVSNRLDATVNGILGAYAIAQDDGALTPIEFYDTRGSTPRQFSLSPRGELLVVGNQSSANMSVFKVDGASGALTYVATTGVCNIPFFARMVER